MKYKFDKPSPPTLTLTLNPEEVILLRTLFGLHIIGNSNNPIRVVATDIYRACSQYTGEFFPDISTSIISSQLIEPGSKIKVNNNTWNLDK